MKRRLMTREPSEQAKRIRELTSMIWQLWRRTEKAPRDPGFKLSGIRSRACRG